MDMTKCRTPKKSGKNDMRSPYNAKKLAVALAAIAVMSVFAAPVLAGSAIKGGASHAMGAGIRAGPSTGTHDDDGNATDGHHDGGAHADDGNVTNDDGPHGDLGDVNATFEVEDKVP